MKNQKDLARRKLRVRDTPSIPNSPKGPFLRLLNRFGLLEHGEALGGLVSIPAAIFSIIATVLALLIAQDANRTADEAMKLVQKDFDSERTAIFAVTVANEEQIAKLTPTDSDQVVLRSEVIFPIELRKLSENSYAMNHYVSVEYPNLEVNISSYYKGLEFLLHEIGRIESPEWGIGRFFYDTFPIIISTNIVANNEAHTVSGLYEVSYGVRVSREGDVDIKIHSVLFQKHLPETYDRDNCLSHLSHLWSPRGFNAYEQLVEERKNYEISYGYYAPVESELPPEGEDGQEAPNESPVEHKESNTW